MRGLRLTFHPCKFTLHNSGITKIRRPGQTGRKGYVMLENYFISPQTLRWLRVGPLGPHMDGIAEKFKEDSYSRLTARELLRGAGHFSRYAMWVGVADAADITSALAEKFLTEHIPTCSCQRPNKGTFNNDRAAVTHVFSYLKENGIISEEQPVIADDPIRTMLDAYCEHLRSIRGLAPKSIGLHNRIIGEFLEHRAETRGALALEKLTGKDVHDYLLIAMPTRNSLDWRKSLTHCMRSFLRYLRWERIVENDLARTVPAVLQWKLADVPRHIPFCDIEKLIDAPDTSTGIGKRDRAILMMLGMLGLRAGEVVALRLDDIDWRLMQIRITEGKSKRERVLPLSSEICAALYDYIKNGRPQTRYRELFLRTRAPLKPLAGSGSLVYIVCRYIQVAGIDAPKKGTHLLRHSLATKLVNSEVPIKDIADILGHDSVQTTMIYTKVDTRRLKNVAMPFPGECACDERTTSERSA